MKKAVFAVCAAMVLLLGLSACSMGGVALDVNGAQIDEAVYSYFLDVAVREQLGPVSRQDAPQAETDATQEQAGFGVYVDDAKAYARANQLCARYVIINSQFQAYGCRLTADEKSAVSKKVNNLWNIYGAYYESIGVAKQTFYKIQENEAFSGALMLRLYDTNGETPVAEEQVRQYYQENYVVFRAVTGYYTHMNDEGEMVPATADERAEIAARFQSMAEKVNAGTDLDTVYNEYLKSLGDETANESLQTVVASKQSVNYPAGFFEGVYAAQQGKAQVVTFGDYIYLVVKNDPFAEDSHYYRQARTACLKGLKADDFEARLATWINETTLTPTQSVAKRCMKHVLAVRPLEQ